MISFNLDSDAYYFEKASELNKMSVKLNNGSTVKVFSEVKRSKKSDNVYRLEAKGDYYDYYEVVWHNKSGKIVLVEKYIIDGEYDYPYEEMIKTSYDKFGNPSKSYNKQIIENKIHNIRIDEAYEWKVLFKNNSAFKIIGKTSNNIIYQRFSPRGEEELSW